MGVPICRTSDILPKIDFAHLRSQMFHLSYTLHGGSGLHFTRADFMEMGVDEIDAHLEYLREQRKSESRRRS